MVAARIANGSGSGAGAALGEYNCAERRAARLSEASAFDNACARTRVIKFIPFSPESA